MSGRPENGMPGLAPLPWIAAGISNGGRPRVYLLAADGDTIAQSDREDALPLFVTIADAINGHGELVRACQLALHLIRETWIEDHGSAIVGDAWGALESALEKVGAPLTCEEIST